MKTKSKKSKYIESHQITCVLNDTKWNRLFEELKKFNGPLRFQRKDLTEKKGDTNYWCSNLYYAMAGWGQIEWLNISAMTGVPRGALLEPTIINRNDLLVRTLSNTGIPFEMHCDGIRVWGYLRPEVSPLWV